MNQLEFFVASSESARSDAWRYLRRLRELDCRIEEDMKCLRETAQAVAGDISWNQQKGADERGGQCRVKEKRKRSSSPGGAEVATLDDDNAFSDTGVESIEPHLARLLSEYRVHRRRVLRQALEREKIAEELKACGYELKELLSSCMTQLKHTLGGNEDGRRREVEWLCPGSAGCGVIAAMTASRRRAARLFTGAFFPEEIARGLLAFAERHQLTSNVWVPKKLVGKLKNDISLIPNAILCDVFLIPGCGVTDLQAIGNDRVIVNAEHTTDPLFFEQYRENIVAGGCASLPLALNGAPERDSLSAKFFSMSCKSGFKSPYWVRKRGRGDGWVNAEETSHLGRYNPIDCVLYEPHTLTNQLFSPQIALLMRRKASRFGYISRTWVTAREGELHGSRLDPKRMKEGPPIFTAQFSGSGQVLAAEYFCADQFENHAAFPTTREIDLAATGVSIGADKVQGYPFLYSLALESSFVNRHRRMAEEMAKHSDPVVFNVFHGVTEPKLKQELKEAFRKFSLLHGFSRPYFLLHTAELVSLLQLKQQAQGIVFTPLKTHDKFFQTTKQSCFFNIEQFEEVLVIEEMVTRTPKHFLIQMPLRGLLLVECARAQCLKRELSQMWIPDHALEYLDGVWKPSPDAVGVPQTIKSRGNSQMMYNLSDLGVSAEAESWWSTYLPHDIDKKFYSGQIKMLLSLRAWERGYTSPLWVTQELMALLGVTQKPRGRRKLFLKGQPFSKPPTVLLGNDTYINIEELKNAEVLLQRVPCEGERTHH